MQIEEKPTGIPPFDTPFSWIGGEARVKALVERFYGPWPMVKQACDTYYFRHTIQV